MRNVLQLVFILILLILVVFYYFIVPDSLNAVILFNILIVNLIALIVFRSRKEPYKLLKKQYVRIMPLFLLGFIVVHFQVYIDYLIGNYENWGVDYLINKKIVLKTALISTSALLSFLLGYLMYNKGVFKRKSRGLKKFNLKGLEVVTILLFVIFLISIDKSFFNGNAIETELNALTEYANKFLLSAIIGIIVLKVYNLLNEKNNQSINFKNYLKSFSKLSLLLIILYILLFLFSGDRGPVLRVGLAFLGGYIVISKKKLKLILVVSMVFGLAYILTLIGYVRVLTDTNSYSEKIELARSNLSEGARINSISPFTTELSGSVRTAHAATDYIERNDFTYGVFQGYQLISIVPGLGLLVNNIFDIQRRDVSSSAFLTYEILGPFPSHGMGTSAVADIYLDFGILGTILLFLYFGYFIRNIEVKTFTNKNIPNLFVLICYFSALISSVYLGRSTIISLLRIIVDIYIVILLGSLFSSFLGMKFKKIIE